MTLAFRDLIFAATIAAALAAPAAHADSKPLRLRELSASFHSASSKIKVAFFDADSTLRISSKTGATYPASPEDVVILPDMAAHIRALNQKGYLVAIVSNQGEVGRGELPMEVATATMSRTVELIGERGGRIDYYDLATGLGHDRKPDIGMAETLERKLQARFGLKAEIDRADSFMVGDAAYLAPKNGRPGELAPNGKIGADYSNADRIFARNFGIGFKESADFFGWRAYGIDKMESEADVESYLSRSRCDHLLQHPNLPQSDRLGPRPADAK